MLQELPTRRGFDVTDTMHDDVNSVAALSTHLRVSLTDHGHDLGTVIRKDLLIFLNHLAHRDRD